MATSLRIPFLSSAGPEKVIVKTTFIEVVFDITPSGLPASYNSDSILARRFTRLISGNSIEAENEEELEVGKEPDTGDEGIEEQDLEYSGSSDESHGQSRKAGFFEDEEEEQKHVEQTGYSPQVSNPSARICSASSGPARLVIDAEPSVPRSVPSFLRSGKAAGSSEKVRSGAPRQTLESVAELEKPSAAALDALSATAITAASVAMEAAGISRLALGYLMQQSLATSRQAAEEDKQGLPRTGVDNQLSATPNPLLPSRMKLPPIAKRPSLEHRAGKPRTTVMLRNLPNNYTRAMVCAMMDKEGFKGQYDFLYLPIDFRSKANLGYAFVNLVEESHVQNFWTSFSGYSKWVLPSSKVCHVSWSGPHQGQKAHLDRYRDSPIMHSSVPDEYKPVVFAAGTGARMDFPPPSKKLRAPRRRCGNGSDAKAG